MIKWVDEAHRDRAGADDGGHRHAHEFFCQILLAPEAATSAVVQNVGTEQRKLRLRVRTVNDGQSCG